MMTLASRILAWLVGSGLKTFTAPALAIGLLVAVHQAVRAHNERIALAATALCDAKWEASIREEERNRAKAATQAVERILESERQTNEELRHDLDKVQQEADELRARAGSDERCLSDGVLDALRGKRK